MTDHFSFIFGGQVFEVPEYMRDSIENYVQLGVAPGSFLTAVICNDLKKSCMYADDNNMCQIPAYVNFFYNHAPADCWGSKEAMDRWVEAGGLIGIRRKREKNENKVEN